MVKEKYKLVLVEDDADDVDLFKTALQRTGLDQSFEVVQCFPTAEEAMDYFNQRPETLEPGTRPEIAIIDINLPRRSGFEVLAALRRNAARPIAAIFTTSKLPEDAEKAASLAADLFLTKTFDSPDFPRFLHFLARIADERRAKRL